MPGSLPHKMAWSATTSWSRDAAQSGLHRKLRLERVAQLRHACDWTLVEHVSSRGDFDRPVTRWRVTVLEAKNEVAWILGVDCETVLRRLAQSILHVLGLKMFVCGNR